MTNDELKALIGNLLRTQQSILKELNEIKTQLATVALRSATHDLMNKPVWDIEEFSIISNRSIRQIHKLTCENRIPFSKEKGREKAPLMFERDRYLNWVKDNRVPTIYEIEQRAEEYVRKKRKK